MQEISHKQGDTFRMSVVFRDPVTKNPSDMTGKTVSIHSRTKNGLRLKGLGIQSLNAAAGMFAIYATPTDTATWAPGLCESDITVIEPDGFVSSTKSFAILVERGV